MTKKLKVALYIPWIYQRGGVERTFLEIIKKSGHDWTVFTHRFEPQGTFPEFSALKVVQVGKVPLKRGFGELAAASAAMITNKLPLDGFDVLVVSTAGFAELVALRNANLPTIAFCHTPLRVIHDPHIKQKYLSEHGNLARLQYGFFSKAYRTAEKLAWEKFRFAIVASREVASRLEAAGICPKEKIEFLKYGVDCKKYEGKARKKYFLLPGRISWTKNVGLGVHAFGRMIQRHPELSNFSLVVAGGVDEKSRDFFEALKKNSEEAKVRFVQNPSDKELNALYANCYCVLFTAINEDWGLVPIEGMAFSKPVIAANQGGPRESIVDKETGFLAEPDEEDFAQKMALLAKNPSLAKKMGEAGKKRAKLYDWAQATKRMDELLRKATSSTPAANSILGAGNQTLTAKEGN